LTLGINCVHWKVFHVKGDNGLRRLAVALDPNPHGEAHSTHCSNEQSPVAPDLRRRGQRRRDERGTNSHDNGANPKPLQK
jgi:hypothetical protein